MSSNHTRNYTLCDPQIAVVRLGGLCDRFRCVCNITCVTGYLLNAGVVF